MTTIRLTVRAEGTSNSWLVDDWTALIALGALSAQPASHPEFFRAIGRYQPDHHWDASDPGDAAIATPDGNWCLLDLDARAVMAGSEFELPDRRAAFRADEDDQQMGGFHIVWINVSPDWLLETARENWEARLAERRGANSRCQRLDSRAVLIGRPLLEFICERMMSVAAADTTGESRRDAIRGIHVDWLMTCRDDLQGRTPREILLSDRERIDVDLQHRSEQWSVQGFAPPPLTPDSAAYRFGGYGTTEVVLIFDLTRSLLDEAWEQVSAGGSSCERLIEQLVEHRERWLDLPPEDGSCSATCRELIESERSRMPVTDNGHFECDCPICQAAADGAFGSSPTFLFFDGHHLELEDEFAFSLTESRQEWEAEQNEFADFSAAMDYRRDALNAGGGQQPGSLWNTSSVIWDDILGDGILGDGEPSKLAKLAIGFPLAELVSELRMRNAEQTAIDALNDSFTVFRRADDPIAEVCAAERLRVCLEHVAKACPDLVPRSADLQSRLDEVLRAANQISPGKKGGED